MRYDICNYINLIFIALFICIYISQLKLHRNVNFHSNILKFLGITKTEAGKILMHLKLVMFSLIK